MALVKKKEEVRPYLPVAYANRVENLPGFDAAEESYLLPIVGGSLYNELVAAYNADTLSPQQKALLERCRAVIVPFAYVASLPFLQTLITDNGLVAFEAEQSRKAFRWEYNNVVNALNERGWSAQENLILFLHSHKADYPLWADSPYHSAGFAIIRNGHELSSSVSLLQPQRCFVLLQGIFSTVEELYLREQLGAAFYEDFTAKIFAGTLSSKEQELLSTLQKATARLALQLAAQELGIRFGDNGFTVIRGTLPDQQGENSASGGQLQRFSNEMAAMGATLLQRAISFLNQHASPTEFASYYNSDRYTDPTTPTSFQNNRNRKGFFAAN